MHVRTLEWLGERPGRLRILDQRALPAAERYIDCDSPEQVFDAIKTLAVRGAPAIGVAAGYGIVLGVQAGRGLADVADYLAEARPTAVNLRWACERMKRAPDALEEARAIEREDADMCRRIGEHAAGLFREGTGVLTHCNAGALATAGMGTALAGVYVAHAAGRKLRVYADETRPLLQGGRLTAWELGRAGVDVTLICDGMSGSLMARGAVDLVIVGADRIARNGDVANKIGTYLKAVAARDCGVPFYVAAPSSTIDWSLPDGSAIPIEERSPDEVLYVQGALDTGNVASVRIAPEGAAAWNPAFDVTPARLVTGLLTERGVCDASEAGLLTLFPERR